MLVVCLGMQNTGSMGSIYIYIYIHIMCIYIYIIHISDKDFFDGLHDLEVQSHPGHKVHDSENHGDCRGLSSYLGRHPFEQSL